MEMWTPWWCKLAPLALQPCCTVLQQQQQQVPERVAWVWFILWGFMGAPPTQTSRSLARRWASMFGLAPPCRKVSPAAPPLLRLDPAKFPAIIHFDWVRCPCEFLKPGACRTTAVQRPRERFEHLS